MAQTPKKQNLRMDEEETFETGEAITIPDGKHRGTIQDVWGEVTPQGFRYVQLGIVPNDFPDATLRYGMPIPEGKPVTPKSKLGQLLESFGFAVGNGESYSIKQIKEKVKGSAVSFITMNEASDKNPNVSFANIVDGSIKPLQ